MISPALLERIACPLCLEAAGCTRCSAAVPGPADYAARAGCACGGPDKVRLESQGETLRCPACATAYKVHAAEGYVDLVPRSSVGEVTQYADHEFHERLHVTDAPPVLSARIKIDMMLGMLRPQPGDTVLDLGCGAGKFALFTGRGAVRAAGVDVAPFFLPRAAREIDLVLGDLRRLPFRKGSYPCAYSLDVLEHLDEPGVAEILLEARRTLVPAGRLFVYTHAMESSRIASFQRFVNRLAKRLGGFGLIDYEREAMRKSDHRNPIKSHEHFEALAAAAGFEVAERRYYNVVFKAVVEDLLLRMVEQWRRGGPAEAHDHGHEPAQGTEAATAKPRAIGGAPPGRLALLAAQGLTQLLKLDIVLFSRTRTGPFFGLLVSAKRPPAS